VVVAVAVAVAVAMVVIQVVLGVAIYRDTNKVAYVTVLLSDDGSSISCRFVYVVHFRGWTLSYNVYRILKEKSAS
jgi:hypothetical protein